MADPNTTEGNFSVPSLADEARRFGEALTNGSVGANGPLRDLLGDDLDTFESDALLLAETASRLADDSSVADRPAFDLGGGFGAYTPEPPEEEDGAAAPPAITFGNVVDVELFGNPEEVATPDAVERQGFAGDVAGDSAPVDYSSLTAGLDDEVPDPGEMFNPAEFDPEPADEDAGDEDAGDEDADSRWDALDDLDQEGFDKLGESEDDPLAGFDFLNGETADENLAGSYDDEALFQPPVPALPGSVGVPTAVPTDSAAVPPTGLDTFPDDYDEVSSPQGDSLLTKVGGFFTGLWDKFKRLSRRIQIAVVAVLVTLLMVVVFGMSGTGQRNNATPPPVVPMTENPVPSSGEEELGPLIPSEVASKCPEPSSSPTLAFSTKPDEAWVCYRSQGIDGNTLMVTFSKPVTISKIRLVPGYNYVESNGKDQWNLHRVVADIKWKINGKVYLQEITPSRTVAEMTFNPPVTTQRLWLVVHRSVEPDKTVGDPGSPGTSPLGGGSPNDAIAIMGLQFIGKEN